MRAHRIALGMTQAELAAAIGMANGQSYISAIERGEQDNLELHTLEKLARALLLSVAELQAGTTPLSMRPPVELLRRLDYSDARIAEFLADWERHPEAARVEIVALVRDMVRLREQHAQRVEAQRKRLDAILHDQDPVLEP